MRFFLFFLLFFRLGCAEVVKIGDNVQQVCALAKRYLPSNPIIIEAGAYDGRDTAKMARFFLKGTIYTFEPVPENFRLVTKATRKFKNVVPFKLALSHETGSAIFYVSEFSSQPGKASASSSLLPPKEHLNLWNEILFPRQIVVDTISLDDFAASQHLTHVDFMWLDMQGNELNVLSCSEIAKTAKVIYSEVEFVDLYEGQALFEDMHNWLKENGFEIIGADFDITRASELAQLGRGFGNILFIRK